MFARACTLCAYDAADMHVRINTHDSCVQDFVVAFMMGTHSRLGAGSPLLLLDPYIAACIAQMIIADSWLVPCMFCSPLSCSLPRKHMHMSSYQHAERLKDHNVNVITHVHVAHEHSKSDLSCVHAVDIHT